MYLAEWIIWITTFKSDSKLAQLMGDTEWAKIQKESSPIHADNLAEE
jgi:hypothetical protein